MYYLDDFLIGYLATAIALMEKPEDADYGIGSLSGEAMDQAIRTCRAFQSEVSLHLEVAYAAHPGYTPERAGCDFWLTHNGHGAGFWDRGLGELGDRLTEASERCREVDLYIGANGRLYFA